MSKNLVLFSGGLDSTYLAYKLLTDTTDEITLLTVVTNNRYCAGLNANQVRMMQPLVAELRKIREFEMKYLYAGPENITSIEMDWWNTYPMYRFADKFNDGTYDKLVSGTTWEQLDGLFYKHSNAKIQQAKHKDAPKLFNSLVQRGELWNPLITHDFHQNFNRWHVLKYLPENLRKKSITCNSGTGDNACGVCDKCGWNNKVQSMINNDSTAADLDDWRRTKSLEYGGTGTRDCSWRWWINLEEGREAICFPSKGLAEDVPADIEIVFPIDTKEKFIKWYSTIEYSPVIDSWLMKWGKTKNDWNPD